MMRIGFIGAGIVGTALALSLVAKGHSVAAVASRSWTSVERFSRYVESQGNGSCLRASHSQQVVDECDLVFITTPDDAIAAVASELIWRPGQYVVHCSGALSNEALRTLADEGVIVGGCHPLQSFCTVAEALDNLPGSTFGLEADEPLLGILKNMTEDIGGHWICLDAKAKTLYHAAGVIASNYTVTLMKMAADLCEQFDVPREEATAALLPLLQGTVRNLARVGMPNCLTGPIARGDAGTINKHLVALEDNCPHLLPAYCEMGLQTLDLAIEKGKLTSRQALIIRQLLNAKLAPGMPTSLPHRHTNRKAAISRLAK